MLAGTSDGSVPLTKRSKINRTILTDHFTEPPRLSTCLYLLISSWIVYTRLRASCWQQSSNSISLVSDNLSIRSLNNASWVHTMEVNLSYLSLVAFASLPNAFTAICALLISACSSSTLYFAFFISTWILILWSTAPLISFSSSTRLFQSLYQTLKIRPQYDCIIENKVELWKIHAPPDDRWYNIEMPLHIKRSGEIIVMSPPSPCQHVPEERFFGQEGNPSSSWFVVPSYHVKLSLLLLSTDFTLGVSEEAVKFQWN